MRLTTAVPFRSHWPTLSGACWLWGELTNTRRCQAEGVCPQAEGRKERSLPLLFVLCLSQLHRLLRTTRLVFPFPLSSRGRPCGGGCSEQPAVHPAGTHLASWLQPMEGVVPEEEARSWLADAGGVQSE